MYKKKIAGMLGLVSLLTVGLVNAAPTVTVVELAPSAQTVKAGDTITLTVHGTDFLSEATASNLSLVWDTKRLQLQSNSAEISTSLGANGWGRFQNASLVVDPAAGQLDLVAYRFSSVGPDFDLVSLNFTVLNTRGSKINIDLGPSNVGDWQDGNGQSITDIDYKGYRLKRKR